MMKKIYFIVVLLFLFAASGLVMAGPRGGGGGERDVLLLGSLNLTAEQIEKIRILRESYRKEDEPLRNRLFGMRMALKLLWMQLKPDSGKIRSLQKEIHNLKWQLQEKRTDYRLAFRDILTPEQLSRYIVLKDGRKRGIRKDRRVR